MILSETYNCDCLKWLEEYSGEPIKLVVTDPPYDLPSWSGGGFMDESKKDWIAQMNVDNLSKSYSIPYFAGLLKKVQGGKINAYFFCNKLQIPEYFKVYVQDEGCKFDILTWHKTNAMPTFHGKYLTDTEYILYFRNAGGGGVIRSRMMTRKHTSLAILTCRTKRSGRTPQSSRSILPGLSYATPAKKAILCLTDSSAAERLGLQLMPKGEGFLVVSSIRSGTRYSKRGMRRSARI